MLTKNPNRVSVLTRYNEVKGNGQPELPCAFWNGDHYNIITSNSEATLEGAAVSGDRLAFRVEVTGDSNVLSCELRDADTGQILESSSSGFGFSDNITFAYYFRANVNWKLYILSDEIYGLSCSIYPIEHYSCDKRNVLLADATGIDLIQGSQSTRVFLDSKSDPGRALSGTVGDGPNPDRYVTPYESSGSDTYLSFRLIPYIGV